LAGPADSTFERSAKMAISNKTATPAVTFGREARSSWDPAHARNDGSARHERPASARAEHRGGRAARRRKRRVRPRRRRINRDGRIAKVACCRSGGRQQRRLSRERTQSIRVTWRPALRTAWPKPYWPLSFHFGTRGSAPPISAIPDAEWAPDRHRLPAVCRRILSFLPVPLDQRADLRPLDVRSGARRRGSWAAHFGLFPDLRSGSDSDRRAVGSLRPTANSERAAAGRGRRRRAVWHGGDLSGSCSRAQ
jgi:hypothetical protein